MKKGRVLTPTALLIGLFISVAAQTAAACPTWILKNGTWYRICVTGGELPVPTSETVSKAFDTLVIDGSDRTAATPVPSRSDDFSEANSPRFAAR